MFLASILEPLTVNDFAKNFYTRKAFYVKGSNAKFRKIFSWEALNRVLNSSPIPHPRIHLVHDNKPITAIDYKSVMQAVHEGATLAIDGVDDLDPNVAKLGSNLSTEFGEPFQINLYLSQPDNAGFSKHYDTHDVFILQIAGYKTWKVFEPSIEEPLFHLKAHGKNPPTDPYLECTLGPGDLVYVPRGHWHEVIAKKEPSLHLTVGLYSRTGIDFLIWFVDELREDVAWRHTFPTVFGETKNQEVPKKHNDYFKKLKKLLIKALDDPEIMTRYKRFCVAQDYNRQPFDFPHQMLKSPVAKFHEKKFFRLPSQRVDFDRSESGKIVLSVWGKTVRLPVVTEPLLNHIFSSSDFDLNDLQKAAPKLSERDISNVLDCLVREGIVRMK